jgi:hypothetical protein
MRRIAIPFIAALALVAAVLPGAAQAAPPTNDDFANATVITALPFADTVQRAEATTEVGEPLGNCSLSTQSVWYSFTPAASGLVRASTAESRSYDASLAVYRQTGSGFEGLQLQACSNFYTSQSSSLQVDAGSTYFIQVGGIYGFGDPTRLTLVDVPPPANDDFADASPISALPFAVSVDTTAATTETSEPSPSCGAVSQTAWYAFTPAQDESVTASMSSPFSTVLAAYSGSSLANLVQVRQLCDQYQVLTFRAQAGTTYYFQLGGYGSGGPDFHFNLSVAPPPQPSFSISPGDPSVFDSPQFYDQSYDPGQVGFSSETWDFGDGASTANPGCCPSHHYAVDGDYTVKLDVTTTDGRTASTSQVVHVKTHDVAITNFEVPRSARVGRTQKLTIGVSNQRYPENVQVDLYRSTPAGLVRFGSLTQSVPVRPRRKTTDFVFSYTFTTDDAAVGRVTFKAVATIVDARDALPSDNESVAPPTKVTA